MLGVIGGCERISHDPDWPCFAVSCARLTMKQAQVWVALTDGGTASVSPARHVPEDRTGGHCQLERGTRCTAMTVAIGAAEIPPST